MSITAFQIIFKSSILQQFSPPKRNCISIVANTIEIICPARIRIAPAIICIPPCNIIIPYRTDMQFATMCITVFIQKCTQTVRIHIFADFIYDDIIYKRININKFSVTRKRIVIICWFKSHFERINISLYIIFLRSIYCQIIRIIIQKTDIFIQRRLIKWVPAIITPASVRFINFNNISTRKLIANSICFFKFRNIYPHTVAFYFFHPYINSHILSVQNQFTIPGSGCIISHLIW